MPDQSITLPFKVPDLFAGFAEGKGLAKASPSELVLEFVVKDTVLDLFKSGMKEIRIPRIRGGCRSTEAGLVRSQSLHSSQEHEAAG